MIGESSPIKARKPTMVKETLSELHRDDPVTHDSKFIVQRVSKVPQPVGQKGALGREVPAISTLLAGTIIAERTRRSRLVL